MSAARPITILVAALGGEGGGVLADWLIEAALHEGFPTQKTSIPGVSQRTGATTYYVEIYPEKDARPPVMALVPSPGSIDLMAASELVEAGRAMQNAFITPERTTLVASTHRIYATSEKMVPSDGRYDAQKILEAAPKVAQKAVLFGFFLLFIDQVELSISLDFAGYAFHVFEEFLEVVVAMLFGYALASSLPSAAGGTSTSAQPLKR